MKQALSLIICCLVLFSALPVFAAAPGENGGEAEYSFGDRILFGGLAVDVGESTAFSERGALFLRNPQGETVLLAQLDAKYLNFAEDRLWFVCGSAIMSCLTDGSDIQTHREFETEISHLYVLENKMLYLRGSTVYSLIGEAEAALLTRDGIEGFVPESENTLRWAKSNPEYVYIEETGDEVWNQSASEFVFFQSEIGSGTDGDIAVASAEPAAEAGEYTGPYVQVGKVTLPLAEHMPGTYFSKNGEACTCHNSPNNYCIVSEGYCNCMRYYPTGQKATCEIDLLGAQCFAFARMVFWKCFGFIDHSINSGLYYNVGSLSRGAVTANSVKALLTKAATGAHIRLSKGHSVSILSMSEDFIVIYHGNAGGDGITTSPCIVSTRRYTWEQFASAAASGISYVNMPYSYPGSSEVLTQKETGYYKLNENLNLRAGATTRDESLAVIPRGTVIDVTETADFWGKTSYNGLEGWVFLEYTTFYSRKAISPSGETFIRGSDGLIRAVAWKTTLAEFTESFDKQSISVTLPNGEKPAESDYITSGSLITLSVNGQLIDSAALCLAGDVNMNGLLDVGDYLLVRRSVLKTAQLTELAAVSADVNGDASVTALDYLLIKRCFLNGDSSIFSGFAEK